MLSFYTLYDVLNSRKILRLSKRYVRMNMPGLETWRITLVKNVESWESQIYQNIKENKFISTRYLLNLMLTHYYRLCWFMNCYVDNERKCNMICVKPIPVTDRLSSRRNFLPINKTHTPTVDFWNSEAYQFDKMSVRANYIIMKRHKLPKSIDD